MAEIPTTLRQQWNHDMSALGAPGQVADRVLSDIVARHNENHRRYHTQRHLAAMFELLERLAPQLAYGAPARLAVWWHDLVYEPRARDNEERSASIAAQRLETLGASASAAAETQELIRRSARHWDGESAGEGDYFLDADVAVLGADPTEYDAYALGIREEYAWAPEDQYRAGRLAFLDWALARPSLFRTKPFAAEFEAAARANMSRERAALAATAP
jgi:predicted metal-dependent HD superfamily phosphohydrolase